MAHNARFADVTLLFSRLTANYMMWQVVHRAVPLLSADFRRARLNLERVVSGTSAAEERWKTCMRSTGGALGMALGSLFVADSFQESSKKAVREGRPAPRKYVLDVTSVG